MAARKAGLSTVPVYVLAATAADTAAETIDRIVHQIVTNDQKQANKNGRHPLSGNHSHERSLSLDPLINRLFVGVSG